MSSKSLLHLIWTATLQYRPSEMINHYWLFPLFFPLQGTEVSYIVYDPAEYQSFSGIWAGCFSLQTAFLEPWALPFPPSLLFVSNIFIPPLARVLLIEVSKFLSSGTRFSAEGISVNNFILISGLNLAVLVLWTFPPALNTCNNIVSVSVCNYVSSPGLSSFTKTNEITKTKKNIFVNLKIKMKFDKKIKL